MAGNLATGRLAWSSKAESSHLIHKHKAELEGANREWRGLWNLTAHPQ